ncbi:unnamed protein product [Effrenium voratum]|nr:unnamed protein product [Effrenium voratum]
MHMRLSGGSPEEAAPTATANARFLHHRHLLWKNVRLNEEEAPQKVKEPRTPSPQAPAPEAEGGDVQKAPSPASSARRPRRPRRVKKNVTFGDLTPEEPVPHFVEPPRTETPPQERFERKPTIKLRSNSRIFQMSSVEVCLNQRRAVKEAKAKAPQGVREPLVTPRENRGHRSVARQRIALAKGLAAGAFLAAGQQAGEREGEDELGSLPQAPTGKRLVSSIQSRADTSSQPSVESGDSREPE